MKNLHLIFLVTAIIWALSPTPVNSQTIGKFENNRWTHESKVYEYSQLGPILAQNSNAKVHFNIALKKRKAARGWGITAGSSAAIGIVALALRKEPESCRSDNFFVAGFGCAIDSGASLVLPAFMLGVITPISGVVSLLVKGKSNKHKQKSIDIFNNEISSLKPQNSKAQLNLVASDRLGIALKF